MIYSVVKEGVIFYVAVIIHDFERRVHCSMDSRYLRKIIYDRYGQLVDIVDNKPFKLNKPVGNL